jgi:hypothetical protein
MANVKFVRQASWYALFVRLTLYADDIEIGKIGAGEELELPLPPNAQALFGEMQGVPMPAMPIELINDGDTVFIRSTASGLNFLSFFNLPLEFAIAQPGDVLDIGSKADKIRSILKASALGAFLIIASIAWVKEGWRLSGYETEVQMKSAEAGGFPNKDVFLAAQAAGISTFQEWEKLKSAALRAGFNDVNAFIEVRDREIEEKKQKEEAERIARAEKARNEELIAKGRYWHSCAVAFGAIGAVSIGAGKDGTDAVSAMKLANRVAIGHLVLAGKTEAEAKALLDKAVLTDPRVAPILRAADRGDALSAARIAVEQIQDCNARATASDPDIRSAAEATENLDF